MMNISQEHTAAASLRHDVRPRAIWLVLAMSLQMVLLTALGATKAYTLVTGTIIELHAQPVDPHDIFRGDYLRLNYDISALPAHPEYHQGDSVFVMLRKE